MLSGKENSFFYGQKGIVPLALTFFDGLYKFFCSIEGEKGIFISTSTDLMNFEDVNIFLEETSVGGASAYVKNEKIYFFYSDKCGKIRSATLDKLGNVLEYPLPMVNRKGLYDPKIFYESNKFYLLCCDKKGSIYLYESENLIDFNLTTYFKISGTFSLCCPSIHRMGEQWAFFYEENGWVKYQKAILDFDNRKVLLDGKKLLLDNTSSPRISALSDGRTIMACLNNGRLVFREIWGKEGKICLFPLSEIRSKRIITDSFEFSEKRKFKFEVTGGDNISVDIILDSSENIKTNIFFGENTVYPEYLWLNNQDKNAVLFTGNPRPILTKRDYFEEEFQFEIYLFEEVIEVYLKKSGMVLSSINPFKGEKNASLQFVDQSKLSGKVVVYSL